MAGVVQKLSALREERKGAPTCASAVGASRRAAREIWGRLRALAVTSIKRSVAVPDVPTVAEAAVPGYDGNTWNGVVAPARTPLTVLRKLSADIAEVLNAPDIKDKLLAQGLAPELSSPAQFDQFIKDEIVKWRKVVQVSGAKLD